MIDAEIRLGGFEFPEIMLMTDIVDKDHKPMSSDIELNGRPSSLQQWFTDQQVNFAALLLFIVLTIIAAWPVVSNLDSVIIGEDNDVYINIWADWWTNKALSNPDISLWNTDYLFYPNGANLIYHSFSHLISLVSLGLGSLVGAIPGYNITMLINLVLNGFSMFQLARYVTKDNTAAILAGIIFAFNSQITYQSSHPVLFTVWCLPWTTLYFMRAVRENSYRFALIAAVIFFLGATTSVLMIILMGLWLVLLVIYMFFSAEFPRPRLKTLMVFGFSSFIFTLPVIFPLLIDAITNRNSSFVIPVEGSLSTEIFSIFVPQWYIVLKRSMYLGIIPLYLFFLATRNIKREGKLWFLLLVSSFLFAIGPYPILLTTRLNIVLPWSLAVIPVLRNMYRVLLLFALGWGMIVAYGWIAMKNVLNLPHRKMLAAALLVGLLIYGEFTIKPYPTTNAAVSSFYSTFLDDVPDDVALAILPTGRQEDKRYLYYQTIHEHPITGGVISRANEETFSFIETNPILRAGAVNLESEPIPDNIEDSFRQLAEINVGYLVLDKEFLEDIEDWREAIPFEPVFEDDLLLVYETSVE
jgi:hypothetical protein